MAFNFPISIRRIIIFFSEKPYIALMGIGACRSRLESEKGWVGEAKKTKLAEGGARRGSIDRTYHFYPSPHSTCSGEAPGGRLWWPLFTLTPASFRVVSAGPGYGAKVFIIFNSVSAHIKLSCLERNHVEIGMFLRSPVAGGGGVSGPKFKNVLCDSLTKMRSPPRHSGTRCVPTPHTSG